MRLNATKVLSWNEPSAPAGMTTDRVYVGPDPFGLSGFQVAVASAVTTPSRQVLRDLFTARKGKTQIQLVVAVTHDGTVHLFGPDPQAQPIELPLDQGQRQLQSVLSEPDVLAATERLAGFRTAHDATAGRTAPYLPVQPALQLDPALLSTAARSSAREDSYPVIVEPILSLWGKPGAAD